MLYYTSPDFTGHHANFPITMSHPTGGMSTKTSAVTHALNCQVVTDLDEQTQGDLIVEPLAIKAPRNVPEELKLGGDSKALREIEQKRIEALIKHQGHKILLCSEMEMLRWPEEMRKSVVDACNGRVYASCEYQKNLFTAVGVNSKVIYEPINEFLFYPTLKRQKQVVAAGSVKHIKNIEEIIEVFRHLEGTEYHRVFVGGNTWAGKVHRKREVEVDMDLYFELKQVCDEFHESSPLTRVARIFSESEFLLNFAFHEVCCRTAMEAMMAGVAVIGGKHPLWKEYRVCAQVSDVDECIKVMEKNTGVTKPKEIRKWAELRFSFQRFSHQIQKAFYED